MPTEYIDEAALLVDEAALIVRVESSESAILAAAATSDASAACTFQTSSVTACLGSEGSFTQQQSIRHRRWGSRQGGPASRKAACGANLQNRIQAEVAPVGIGGFLLASALKGKLRLGGQRWEDPEEARHVVPHHQHSACAGQHGKVEHRPTGPAHPEAGQLGLRSRAPPAEPVSQPGTAPLQSSAPC